MSLAFLVVCNSNISLIPPYAHFLCWSIFLLFNIFLSLIFSFKVSISLTSVTTSYCQDAEKKSLKHNLPSNKRLFKIRSRHCFFKISFYSIWYVIHFFSFCRGRYLWTLGYYGSIEKSQILILEQKWIWYCRNDSLWTKPEICPKTFSLLRSFFIPWRNNEFVQ